MSSNPTSFRLPSAYQIPTHIEHEGQQIKLPTQIRDNVRMLFNGLLDAHQAIVELNNRPSGGTTNVTNVTNNTTVQGSTTPTFNTAGQGYMFSAGLYLPIPAIFHSAGGGASYQTSPNRVNCCQFIQPNFNFQISQFTMNVIANALGKFAGFGFYSADGTTLLIDSGPLSLNSIAVVQGIKQSGTLNAGTTYIFAQTSDTTTAQILVTASLAQSYADMFNGNAAAPRYFLAGNASAAGQLPSSLGTFTAVTAATVFDLALVMCEP